MIIILGERHLRKKQRVCELDWCAHCGALGVLESYTATNWATAFFIPVLPLGRMHVMRICPNCGNFLRMKRKKLRDVAIRNTFREGKAICAERPTEAAEAMANLMHLGAMAEANELFEDIGRKADPASTAMVRAWYHQLLNQLDEAETACREWLAASSEPAVAYHQLGRILEQGSRTNEAIQSLQNATATESEDVLSREMLMVLLARDKRWNDLLPVMQDLARIAPARAEHRDFKKLLKKAQKKSTVPVGENPYQDI